MRPDNGCAKIRDGDRMVLWMLSWQSWHRIERGENNENHGAIGVSDREEGTYLDDDTRTFHTDGNAYNPNQINHKVTYSGLPCQKEQLSLVQLRR